MLGPECASAALVVVGWLAQAEPAPQAQPHPQAQPATQAQPAPQAQPATQIEPATQGEPGPAGPAEAAPYEDPAPVAASPVPLPSPVTDPDVSASHPLLNAVAVHARLATRAAGPDAAFPREGFSLGGAYERRYASVGGVLGLGVGVDFFFDRFATGSTQNSFVALQTLVLERVPVRPWIAAGPGLAVATSTRAVVRGAVGLELPFSRGSAVAVRADLTHALSGDRTFGDLVDVGLGLVERF